MGHPTAQLLVAIGGPEEIDDLRQLGLGLVDPGHVVERHPDRVRVHAACLRPAERPQPAQATTAGGRGATHQVPE
jgi:hypothetical protein